MLTIIIAHAIILYNQNLFATFKLFHRISFVKNNNEGALIVLFLKKSKIERQMMKEIKASAGVGEFPFEDAKTIAELLTAYERGEVFVSLAFFSPKNMALFDKYPKLGDNWDNIMIKYKKQGLFPNWDIVLIDD